MRAKDIIENSNEMGLLKYISRYVRHPAIAQSRIVEFDGRTVTFICDKGEKTERRISMPVIDFLLALAQHIPPKGFHMVKHLGFYANRVRSKYSSVFSMFEGICAGMQKRLFRIAKRCHICGEPMRLVERIHTTDPPPHLLLSSYTGQLQLAPSVQSINLRR